MLDFLEVYPEYKNRPFYLTGTHFFLYLRLLLCFKLIFSGESYGGVYVPSTSIKLIELIQVIMLFRLIIKYCTNSSPATFPT